MASPAAVLQVFVNANTKVASAQLAAVDRQLQAVGKRAGLTEAQIGKFSKGAAAAGVGIAALGAAAVVAGKELFQLGKEFDNAYDTIRVRTGATGRELESLKATFRDVAKDVPSDFENIGVAIGDLNTRLGLTGKPLERMAENLLVLSELTGQDLETNIKSVARSFVDWEITIPKQTRALDGLFRLSQASGASVAEIADSVQRFGSPLRQLGFSFEEAAAMFANFERAGVNTQTMVPGLKLAISNLTRPTENLAAQMSKLGIEAGKPDVALRQIFKLLGSGSTLSQIEKTGLAMDVFGKRAGADMAEAIKQGRFELDRFLALMRDGDTIKQAYKDTADFNENMREFGNNLKVLVEPAAMGVFDALTKISQVLASDKGSETVSNFGKVIKSTFQLATLDVKGFIDTITGGDESEKPNIYQRIAQSAPKALEILGNVTSRLKGLREKSAQAAQAEKAAEQKLIRVREQYGPRSREAIMAEAELRRAIERSTRARQRAKEAEQLQGPVKRATKNILREEVANLKTEVVRRKRAIQVLGAQLDIEMKRDRGSKRSLQLSDQIRNAASKQSEAQRKLNTIIARAGTQIGPQFAKTLERMRARTGAVRAALGDLRGPMSKFKSTAKSAFEGAGRAAGNLSKATERVKRKSKGDFNDLSKAAERSSKRIKSSIQSIPGPVRGAYGRLASYANNAAEAFGSNDRVRLSFRRGGMAKFSGPGLVPAMVSPGELISYKGREVYVPGRPEPRDSVMMHLPPGAKVFTFDGQARLAMGASQNDALRKQAPHFATGGIVANAPKPKLVGGPRVPRATGQSAIDRGREQAMDWVKKLKPTLDMITRIARGFGLDMTSGYRPGDDGYHGVDRARDYSNSSGPTREMFKFGTYVADNYQKHLLELIYTPLGFGIKNGARTAPYAAADHYDHVHVAMQKGGIVPRFKKGGWVKTGYTVFDDPGGGYLGHLQQGKGYAELGTATQGGVATNRGYIAQALGMSGELRDKFPLDVMIGGKKQKMFKRDRGYGQGTPAYSIDIYQDSWPFFGLNRFSKGTAFIRKSASQREIKKVKRAAQRVIDRIKEARRKGGLQGFLDAARKNAGKALGLADEGEVDRARAKLDKARRQIRKAMKGRKPGGGDSGSGGGSGGGAAPGPIDPTLPGMPTGNTLEDLRRAVAFLQEDADLFDEQAGLDWSPGGSELDPTERATLISKNQALLAKLIELRDKLVATINYWQDRVPKLRDKVKRARDAIKDLRKKIKGSKDEKKIKKWQKQIKGHQNDIKGWDKGISKGTDLLGSLPDELDGIQGVTGRGGDIARVQLVLAELGRPAAVDPADTGGDSEIANLLRQQLQETQRALAISQAQMPIFQQFMPRFHQGGIVQGPTGAERPVMAQAGEGIFTRDQMRAMGSQNITVVIEDAAIDSNRIRVEVDGVIQDKVSTVRRQGSNRRFVTSR